MILLVTPASNPIKVQRDRLKGSPWLAWEEDKCFIWNTSNFKMILSCYSLVPAYKSELEL